MRRGARRRPSVVVGERPIHVACALVLLVLAHGQATRLWPGPWAYWTLLALVGLAAGAGITMLILGARSPR